MNKQSLVVLFTISILCISCHNSYDSNAVNKKLLQGEWLLKQTNIDNPEIFDHDSILFVFKGDTCSEYINNIKHQEDYRMTIDNYELELSSDNEIVNKLNIYFLSEDSLVLNKGKNWWIYKKISPTGSYRTY